MLDALRGSGHVCSVYENRHGYRSVLKAFVGIGLKRGEKCLWAVSGASEGSLREEMRGAIPPIDQAIGGPAVEIVSIEHAYARDGLSPERALDFWCAATERAIAAGFSGLRGVIQADRAVGSTAMLARWIEYENQLTQMLGERGGMVLCLYNRSAHPAEFLRDVLQAHPILAHRDMVGGNTFHVPPEEYRSRDRASLEADRILATAADRGRHESAMRHVHAKLLQKASRRLRGALRGVKACAVAIRVLSAEVTSHTREEAELRRRIDYLSLGQQITQTGSWAWNPSSGTLFWSREHFRIFGLDPTLTLVSYQLFLQMVHPDERARVEQALQEAVRLGRDFDYEYRICCLDGPVKHIHSLAYPVFGESGEITEYIGTVVDITQRRQGEEILGSIQAELSHASRAIAIRELTASIAHEVNQPLAAVIANAGAATRWLDRDEPRIDKTRQALSRIVRDGKRVTEVIARVRSLVTSAGAQRHPVNLNSVVREVLVLVRAELRRCGVSARTELAENLPSIAADRVQMQQVVLNLITNAIEAMGGDAVPSGQLVVGTTSDSDAVVVSVRDCGIGIDAQMLERVFDPFFTTKPRGMGIGLAISRSIVEAHGGRVWATRGTAAGMTFQFRLPHGGVRVG